MKMMKVAGRSAKRLAFGLGVGLLAALATPLLMPTRAARVQSQATQKTVESPARKADDASATASPSKNKPGTTKVEKGPFKIELVLNGIFAAQRTTEVSIRPKAWAMPLQVDRAIELGRPVKKGDILVEFVRDKIDKLIEDTVVENTITDLASKQAEDELPLLERALPIELAAATRAKAQADEDLKRFFAIDKPDSERIVQYMVKQSVEYLEYAKEELRQLEKMYRSKDLTEETEEIILRRQRFQVDSREHYLKEAERTARTEVDDRPAAAGRADPGSRRQAGDRPGKSPLAGSLDPESEAAHRRQAQVRLLQIGRKARGSAPGSRCDDGPLTERRPRLLRPVRRRALAGGRRHGPEAPARGDHRAGRSLRDGRRRSPDRHPCHRRRERSPRLTEPGTAQRPCHGHR